MNRPVEASKFRDQDICQCRFGLTSTPSNVPVYTFPCSSHLMPSGAPQSTSANNRLLHSKGTSPTTSYAYLCGQRVNLKYLTLKIEDPAYSHGSHSTSHLCTVAMDIICVRDVACAPVWRANDPIWLG